MVWWLFYTQDKAEASKESEFSTLGTAFECLLCDLMPSQGCFRDAQWTIFERTEIAAELWVCVSVFVSTTSKKSGQILSLECFSFQHIWKLKDACMSRTIGKGKYTAAEWYNYLSLLPISLISHFPCLDNEVTDTFVETHTKLNRGKSG